MVDGGACTGGTSGSSGKPHQTNTPSASIAASLNSDSNAIARIRPRLCSAALARRVPNSIANTAIASATYSALSCQAGSASLPGDRVSRAKLIATAFNCSAM